jgi:hypothetical protein
MKKTMMLAVFTVLVCLLAAWPKPVRAQGNYEVVTGDAFTRAVPADFYLEGNRIPVEKSNAALVKSPKGARLVVALIDTTGYSSRIQQKYIGMIITESTTSVCGNALGVGSYGFGLERPAPSSNADAPFKIYNQAGEKVGECAAKKDDSIAQPRPLAVVPDKTGSAKILLGKYGIEIK